MNTFDLLHNDLFSEETTPDYIWEAKLFDEKRGTFIARRVLHHTNRGWQRRENPTNEEMNPYAEIWLFTGSVRREQ